MKWVAMYSGTKAENMRKAREDVLFYIGRAKMLNLLSKMAEQCVDSRSTGTAYRRTTFMCSLVGISGYWPRRWVAYEVLKRVKLMREVQQQKTTA
jgi:hypothetical protein